MRLYMKKCIYTQQHESLEFGWGACTRDIKDEDPKKLRIHMKVRRLDYWKTCK